MNALTYGSKSWFGYHFLIARGLVSAGCIRLELTESFLFSLLAFAETRRHVTVESLRSRQHPNGHSPPSFLFSSRPPLLIQFICSHCSRSSMDPRDDVSEPESDVDAHLRVRRFLDPVHDYGEVALFFRKTRFLTADNHGTVAFEPRVAAFIDT